MNGDTKQRADPKRHPADAIPLALIQDINLRAYLARLEPPMTIEQSRKSVIYDARSEVLKVISNHETRVKNALFDVPLTRAYLRVLVDMGLIDPAAHRATSPVDAGGIFDLGS
jgi:hypothetical protein